MVELYRRTAEIYFVAVRTCMRRMISCYTSTFCAMQVSRLLELLEQHMIQDTTKLLSKHHHLMLNERERDEAILPLDLWKTPVR